MGLGELEYSYSYLSFYIHQYTCWGDYLAFMEIPMLSLQQSICVSFYIHQCTCWGDYLAFMEIPMLSLQQSICVSVCLVYVLLYSKIYCFKFHGQYFSDSQELLFIWKVWQVLPQSPAIARHCLYVLSPYLGLLLLSMDK